MDRGVWQATVLGAAQSQTRLKQLSMHEDKHTPWKKEIITASSSYPIFIRICQGLGKAFVFWKLSEQGHLNLVQCRTPGPGNHPRDVFHLLQGEKPLKQLCVPTALQNLVMSHIWLFGHPVDYSPPGSSVPGISQARTLEWVALPSWRESFWPRDQTCVSCTSRQIPYHWTTREAHLAKQEQESHSWLSFWLWKEPQSTDKRWTAQAQPCFPSTGVARCLFQATLNRCDVSPYPIT